MNKPRQEKKRISANAKTKTQICGFVFFKLVAQSLFFLYPKFQASNNLCSCTDRVVSDMVGNSKERFSCVASHFLLLSVL